MELGQYLTFTKLNELNVELEEISKELKQNNYPHDIFVGLKVNQLYPPELFVALFTSQEQLISTLDSIVDWVNPYSGKKIWEAKNGALYVGVKRWFDWVEFTKKIINNEIQKTNYLYVTEYGKPLQLYDENGEEILAFDGYFKQ